MPSEEDKSKEQQAAESEVESLQSSSSPLKRHAWQRCLQTPKKQTIR
jgi:hypothetical protein